MTVSCPNMQSWHSDLPLGSRWQVAIGFAVLLLCIAGFGGWAALAPLHGAVVASGAFVATGQNKQVQHLEGGILRELLITEGQVVEPGQVLVRLDDTAANARHRRLTLRRYRLLVTRARLEAEIYDRAELAVPEALADLATEPEITDILARQRVELEAKRIKLKGEQEVLRKEIAGLGESISGFEARAASTRDRIGLFQDELKDKSALLDRQLTRKSDVLAIQRAEAGLAGELGELIGRTADARERIARAEQQIEALRAAAIQRAITELREAEAELDDVDEQIRTAKDIADRVEVKSPVKGAVVKIHQQTLGGVIAPGAVILELLPINDELVIEARVDPSQITHVHQGQDALVRLSALNQRLTPMIRGRVAYVSPDSIAEAATPQPERGETFVVRVKLDPEDVRQHANGFRPTPGMPADLFIKTMDRTFLDYIMTPVFDSFSRAFREQ